METRSDWLGPDEDAPITVKAVPRFRDDVEALLELSAVQEPPHRKVRCFRTGRAYYGFGDASSKGFGSTLQFSDDVYYEYGQWSAEISEKSSNWRELKNLVKGIKYACEKHELTGSELFIFTDNSTAENSFHKGYSSSKELSALVLELRKMEMNFNIIIRMIHVSGKRMIKQGTDGLSRGDHGEGVMRGTPMIEFVPLGKSAFDRAPSLRGWMKDLLGGISHSFLTDYDLVLCTLCMQ